MFDLFKRPQAGAWQWLVRVSILAGLVYIPTSQAALTMNGTRIIFNGDKRSVAQVIANPSTKPFAVQTWINTAADDTTTPVPFAVTPPLFKISPNKEQYVQINALPNNLPADRESLFYFNIQEIPQVESTQGNALNIALRMRIKMFYRPSAIKDSPMARLKDLQWSIKTIAGKAQLQVHNPTPFHYTFISLNVQQKNAAQQLKNPPMAAPFSTQTYALNELKAGPDMQVVFSIINDYGGYSPDSTLPLSIQP